MDLFIKAMARKNNIYRYLKDYGSYKEDSSGQSKIICMMTKNCILEINFRLYDGAKHFTRNGLEGSLYPSLSWSSSQTDLKLKVEEELESKKINWSSNITGMDPVSVRNYNLNKMIETWIQG